MGRESEGESVSGRYADGSPSAPGYMHKTLIVLCIGTVFLAAGALLWNASQALLLIFAGVLVAILLQDAGRQIHRWLPVSARVSMVLVLLLVLIVLIAGTWLLAPRISDQAMQLWDQLPGALQGLRDYLQRNPVLRHVARWLPQPEQLMSGASGIAAQAGNLFSGVLGSLVNIVIVFLSVFISRCSLAPMSMA